MNKNRWGVCAAGAVALLLAFSLVGRSAAANSAGSLVEDFNTALIGVVKTADRRIHERYEMLLQPVERTFNLPFMLQQAVGSRWRGATDDERSKLVAAFARFSIGTFLFRFRDYAGESFKMVGEGEGPDGTRLVYTELVRPNQPSVPVTYVARQFGPSWQVVDLLIAGSVSELAMRRSEYVSVLSRLGMSGLISRLNARADQILSVEPSSASQGKVPAAP